MSKRTWSVLMSLILAFSLLSGFLGPEIARASAFPALTRVQAKISPASAGTPSIGIVNSGDKVTLWGKLCDPSGNGLTNKTLTFYVGGFRVGQVQTGGDGWAQLNYTANLLAGPYQVKVAFEGDGQYYSSWDVLELVVTSPPVRKS